LRVARGARRDPHHAHDQAAYWDEAHAALAARDAVLASLIAAYPGLHLTRRGDPFTTLARAIVGQQISLKAAQTIWDRLLASAARRGGPLDPARVQRKRSRRCAHAGCPSARRSTSATSRATSCPPASIRRRGRRSTTRR
jgi:3-methyladenine DNA glycosylase/8-oxoguanine DNA glycosylase